MDGLKIGEVTLFLGKLPNRKQQCFYFEEGSTIYPVAYVAEKHLAHAQIYWERMLAGLPRTRLNPQEFCGID